MLDLDLVLFGAAGFTGRLAAAYLAGRRHGLRWALAGRSREKLVALRDELGDGALPIIVADAADARAMDALASRARVIASAAGPYARHGLGLVRAAAARGVHYCDLTGETTFVRASIDACHALAESTGARVVHCAGFDSIPSDLGVYLLHRHLEARGDGIVEAHSRVTRLRGRMSPGTLTTMIDLFAQAADPGVRRVLTDPYALDPRDDRDERSGPIDQLGPIRDPDTGRWTAPFVMAATNTRVVRRTNALLGYAYGHDFHYDEALDMGPGAAGFGRAMMVSGALAGLFTAALVPPARAVLERLLPVLGDGPEEDARREGCFRIEIGATSRRGAILRAVIEGERDPGYDASAIMLAETALCLAEDDGGARGGVLTPAAALGTALAARLREAGIAMRVEVPQGPRRCSSLR